jgi:CBS-domain-containing membrane protein
LLAERRGGKGGAIDEEENIGSIPVIENEQTKKLVGNRSRCADARDPKATKVEEVMTRNVVTCRPGDDLEKALDAMSEHQLRRIPVVDDGNKLVGIIAQADVATRVNQPQKTAETVEGISQSSRK